MKDLLSKINLMISGMIIGHVIGHMFGFDNRIVLVLAVFLGFGLGNAVARMLDERKKK